MSLPETRSPSVLSKNVSMSSLGFLAADSKTLLKKTQEVTKNTIRGGTCPLLDL
jgi:hypothetical protein